VLALGLFLGWRALHARDARLDRPVELADQAEPEAEAAAEPSREEVKLPSRAESDVKLRDLLAPLSRLPEWAAFLKPQDLLNRIVAGVDNVAEGKSPRDALDFAPPKGPFAVDRAAGKTVMSDAAMARYDGFAKLIASLDAAQATEAYRTLLPTLRTAYHRFGYPDRDFDAVVKKALDRLVAVPVVERPLLASEAGALYRYANSAQERADELSKQLWRMGPSNQRRIQAKADELRRALGR
jgi:hypothetical protein